MSTSCIFCRIISGQVPAAPVYQDDEVFAFRDVNPQAPKHLLLVPRRHVATLPELSAPEDAALLGRLLQAAARVAQSEGLTDGFRLVLNTGPDAGQTVHHVHVHVLGGRTLHWPPG